MNIPAACGRGMYPKGFKVPLFKGDLGGSRALNGTTNTCVDTVAEQANATPITQIPAVNEIEPSSTSAADLLAQESSPAAAIAVTGVKLNRTATELEIVLETPEGQSLQIDASQFRSEGTALIADIPNAVLALPNSQTFQAETPTPDIAKITVEQQTPNSVRISVIGSQALPQIPVVLKTGAFSYSLNPESEGAEEEIVVTGQGQDGYFVPDATTATKTDTPLRDIPASIQVVPKEVIQDQGVTRISDALRNVSGVTPQRDYSDDTDTRFNIRGFSNESATLRNGFRVGASEIAPNNIERIEVLKGPASVLYGQFEPGGIVNFVTKQPLDTPFYSASFTAGNFSFYEPSIDISGPLTADKNLLYRLTAAYQNTGSFRDFVKGEQFSVAPTLSYQFSEATKLTVGYEFLSSDQTFDDGLPIDPITFRLPRSRFLGEPDNFIRSTTHNLNAAIEYQFNENISLKSAFGASLKRTRQESVRLFDFDPTTNQIDRLYRVDNQPSIEDTLSWQTDLVFKFNTGPIQHQLLFGVELAQSQFKQNDSDSDTGFFIDVINPTYGAPIPPSVSFFSSDSTSNTVGVYLQDQITLLPNLKLLVGGRYDFSNAKSSFNEEFPPDPPFVGNDEFNNQAFSPRVGIVYQPIEPISLYASFSTSFVPNNSTTATGELIKPTRGTQYEVGVKAELGRFSATLAAYQITKTNILTPDPDNPDFSIPVGEARSRGLEFDITGEILPGWNIIASAFLNNTEVTQDNALPVGDTLVNAPKHGVSFWTTYELQKGLPKGLGFGLGIFYAGDRQAELPNDFVLPSYVRTDASIFYKRDRWRIGLNFKNLFSTPYFESSQNTALIYPGAPFTVLGTVSVQF
ncbi:MAG: TonB-dependent siderophore receptor [Aphanocapsa sp. GSE-SYN-MK-11-07L]|nr:TonB-dependent siderophore receptor [Aphanocapsa sp. GSE-SYN-MK-11-07L]